MINKFLFWLSGRLPCRLIYIDDMPYLERYSVGKWFGMSFYLHRFVGMDEEREVHDHPWAWAYSLVLTGSYLEEVVFALDLDRGWLSGLHRIRWFNRLGPNVFHRIVRPAPRTWTLFVHGKRIKTWGFLKHIDPGGGLSNKLVMYYQPYDTKASAGWAEKCSRGCESRRAPL